MTLLQDFAATRAATLGLANGLSQEELDRRPRPDKWSVGEILDHLLRAEGYLHGELRELIGLARAGRRPFIRRSFSEVDISVAFIPRPLLSLFELPISLAGMFVPAPVRDFILRNRLIPAQNPSFATPQPGRPADELRSDLAASLEHLRQLLEQNADLDGRQLILQHPLLGTLDLTGMLRFLILHEQRHQDQIQEALRALAAGSAAKRGC